MEQNTEKKMTKYDRKLQARAAAAKQAKKKNILSIVATVAVIACIAALLIGIPVMKNRKLFKEFFRINNKSVSVLEFNFHRTNLINNYAQYLQYFGMSSLDDIETTVYDEEKGTTWGDYFTECAANSIKENRALIADAKEKKVSLDVDAQYKTYMNQIKTQAEAAGMTSDAYLTSMYGAKESQLKSIIKDNLTAVLYSDYLTKTNAATDEDAQAEYDANKDKYDSVDYRVLSFAPAIPEGAGEEEIEAVKNETKAKAQEMLDKVKAGEDFETLCATYAPEDKRANYADSETDLSLVTGETSSYASGPYSSWLFESARTAGDSTIYTDENSGVHYVLLFEKRYMEDTVLENIKQNLTYTTVTDYINKVSESYVISDPDDNLPTL